MVILDFIEELKQRKDLREVVHHEELGARAASYSDILLSKEIQGALKRLKIPSLFSHQAEGIEMIREGRNVVVMTPTASGKSLIYNIPVIESILSDPGASALYLFPLKGLEQDQQRAFSELTEGLVLNAEDKAPARGKRRRSFSPGLSEIYDGDTSAYRRKKIREAQVPVILTNPDMLHLAINAYHQKWEGFLRNLKYIIIDELHIYRGVFGSHVAHVFKRLRRILARYGADPVFITCSATIANPGSLARMLTGLDFEVIDRSGAPQGTRHFIFINPPKETSPLTVGNKVFTASVKGGLRTIAFTKSRKVTELMHMWVKRSAPDIADRVCSYRAGFLPVERRAIEQRLFKGELSGIISTSALELGVDIGGLDVCVLVGYPGTISSTWQRSGRVGRSGGDSLIIMVAGNDALDQYFMRNPQDFFRRPVEAAVLDAENHPIAKEHLKCAAAEFYIKSDDLFYDTRLFAPALKELQDEGYVRHWEKGDTWYSRKRFPHREVSIRGAGVTFLIRDCNGTPIGETSASRVFREQHPGAIYLHKGMQYRVEKLDLANKEVVCRPADDVEYYTRPISDEETEIISTLATKRLNRLEINCGKLKVTESVLGYRKKHLHTDKLIGEYLLDLPPSVFTTTGIWMGVEQALLDEIGGRGFSADGGLHALEHAAIATLPLFALCDRMDLGGVSYPFNPELKGPAIFIYDGHEGGVGLTKRGFSCIGEWLASTLSLMEDCPCEVSCPSCTQDMKCGNNNEPLDKRAAIIILKDWLDI